MPLGAFNDGQYEDRDNRRAYVPIYGSGSYSGQDNYTPGQLTGYRGYDYAPGMYSDASELNGRPYDIYDTNLNRTGSGTWSGLGGLPPWAYAAIPIAAAAGMYGLQGAGLLGAGSAGTGAAFDTAAFEGIGGAAGAGGAAGGAAALPTMAPIELLDPAIAGSALPTIGTTSGAGVAGAASGLSDIARYAAPLVGAALGSRGVQNQQTSTSRMDPRMDEYVYGSLMPAARNLMTSQLTPERQQRSQQMQGLGYGLMTSPLGQGFNRFYGGR